MLLSPPQASTPNPATPFISLLALLDALSIGNRLARRKSPKVRQKLNFTLWQLPVRLPDRLLIRESFTKDLVMTLRCDNTASIAMLEEPGWRSRYISTYGEAARQEIFSGTMVVTYVPTDLQLADPMTKPTCALISSIIFPQWGLVSFTQGRSD